MSIYIDSKLFYIISYHKHLYHDIYSYRLYHTSLAHRYTHSYEAKEFKRQLNKSQVVIDNMIGCN